MRDWSKRLFSTVLAVTLLVSNIQPVFAFAAEAKDTGLCEHHVTHENCGYVAAVAGSDCTHEHDNGCFTVKCIHVHGDCGYVAAVEGVDCDHQHDGACAYAEAVAEVPCTCQQEEHTDDCDYAPAIPEVKCNHVHGECSFVEAKSEVPCGHDCSQDEACGEKVLNCTHSHDESCGYVASVEGKACDFVCEVCAAEEASAAAVAEVKALMEALPELEAVQAMSMKGQKTAYEQTQAAYEAYGKLTADQQQELADPEEVFKPLFEYFNTLVDADGELGSGTPDSTPPVLKEITLSATTVIAPNTIEIIMNATDDVSGLDYAQLQFYCEATDKALHLTLNSKYYDEEAGSEIAYADGLLHGTLKIDQYVETGTFVVRSVNLYDIAENSRYYYRGSINDPLPESVENLQLNIVDPDAFDSTPPVLKSVAFSTISVTAPGVIEITAEATDDVSGVDYAQVQFYCEDTGKVLHLHLNSKYYDEEAGSEIAYADGLLHGTLKIDQYVETGTFVVRSVNLYDVAENSRYYYRGSTNDLLPESVENLQFNVIESDTPDSTPPVLNSIAVSAANVTAPGIIEVTLDATDDVSGLDYAQVQFHCDTTDKALHLTLDSKYYDEEAGKEVAYADGLLHGTLKIDQYVETGTFVVRSVNLYDIAENSRYYYRDNSTNTLPEPVYNFTFKVFNTIPEVTTSTSQSSFVEQVTNAANDAYIVADFSSNSTLSKEAFDGIAGTDKTLDLTSEGVTWRFDGSDITNTTKDIDLSVQISKAESNTSDAGQAIRDKLNDNPGYIMKFAENGELPGKAIIQIKVDYAMREHLGSSTGLNVYYYNNQTGELELVAENLSVINDTYVEFSITHCSYYVLTPSLNGSENSFSGTCGDNLTWRFDKSTGMLAISGSGSMPSIMNWNAPWSDFFGQIKVVELDDNITGIAPNAFMNCTLLEEIVIPQNVFTVGDQAFSGCSALSKVTFLGGCHFIHENTFSGVKATVYYPAGYYQWQGQLEQYGGNLTWVEYGSKAKQIEFETFGELVIPGNTFEVSVNESPWDASINCRFVIDSESVARIVSSTTKDCEIEVLTTGTFTLTATDQNSGLTISKQFDARAESISCPYSESFVVREGETTKYYSFTPNESGEYVFKISMATLAHPDAHRLSVLDDDGQIVGGYIGGQILGASSLAYGAILEAERTYSVMVSYVDCIAESEEQFSVEMASDHANIICIDEETVEIEKGFSFALIGAYVFPGCNDDEVKWEIDDESIVEFNTTGHAYSDTYYKSCRFQAKQAGSTTVTATYGNVQDSVIVTVIEPEINKLLLDTPKQVVSNDGNNVSLEFTAPADGRYAFTAEGIGLRCDNAIRFMSADDDDNIVYGYGENSCKAYITMKSGETCTISVSGFQISMNAAYEPSWSAVVTATCADDRPTSLKIKQLISRDGTIRLGAYFTPENYAEKVVWKVSDENIIGRNHSDNDTFSYYNEVEYDVYASGQVTIAATSESGLKDSVTLVLSENNGTIRQKLDDGILILYGNGAMDDYTYTLPSWDFYRYDITGVIVEEGITSISNRAFQNHTQIKTVKIADTVNTVGNIAFEGCSSLNEITFEGNAPLISSDAFASVTATAYYPAGNTSWTADIMQNYGGNITWKPSGDIIISGSCGKNLTWEFDQVTGTLTISGSGAMDDYPSVLVNGVLKEVAPWYYYEVKKAVILDGVTHIGKSAFQSQTYMNAVEIPESVTSIGTMAFCECSNLSAVTLPESITDIGVSAFLSCEKLSSVNIPANVTIINDSAFAHCSSLSNVTIPSGVTRIGDNAFIYSGLTSIVIPEKVTSIGGSAFDACNKLTKIIFIGNAPQFITSGPHATATDSVFYGVTATAYYPAGNKTWTDEVMRNYGGKITWKPYCPNGHTVVTDKAVEATCTATGLTEGKHCSACGEVLTAQITVAAKDHNYVNGYCSRCGTVAPTSGGSTGDGGSTNTGTGNTGTTTHPNTQLSQNGAELSAKELEASADRNASTTIAVDGIRITFDAKAQKAIADQAAKDDIYLHYEEIKEAKLNKDQKKAIKDHLDDHKGQKHVLTFSITLISGGKEIHDFKGGTATVKIPFTPNPGTKGDAYKVFFVDSNGELHPMETTYENGYLVVKLTHFSEYVVFHMPEEVAEETTEATETATVAEVAASEESAVTEAESIQAVKTSKTDAIGMILWIVITLCIVGIVVIGVILLKMRKKQ